MPSLKAALERAMRKREQLPLPNSLARALKEAMNAPDAGTFAFAPIFSGIIGGVWYWIVGFPRADPPVTARP